MEKRSCLITPVKVWAPSAHRSEEWVVSEANDPTSRTVQRDRSREKDSWVTAFGTFRKGENKKTLGMWQGGDNTKVVRLVSVAVGSSPITVASKGVGNMGGKVDGNGQRLKEKSDATVPKDGSKDGKVVDCGEESSTMDQGNDGAGCVVGPHEEDSSVWIVGYSFIRCAAKQADSRPFGRQLGFDGLQVKIV
ncbi:hypothetical protein NDU88_002870 [Pleurodeles waltl]|uniref:Uncharacterized protein n=1 Tax=Pleurodeles waltl TaxID=8319 RepID=A0AAV7RBK1_PLEWA|nr:hypothetical protein NDU88_002870 [Pleurodeles waltl]